MREVQHLAFCVVPVDVDQGDLVSQAFLGQGISTGRTNGPAAVR